MTALGVVTLVIWLALLAARGGFWRIDRPPPSPNPSAWPEVVAVVPARDEAEVIGTALASLLGQGYPGRLSVIVVDDGSCDGTAELARMAGPVTVLAGDPPPPGWGGKTWAMAQGLGNGLALHPEATYVLFTDADIRHAPGELTALVARAEAGRLDLASLMVRLRCVSLPERFTIPAFVFFFRLLYPFRRVADPASGVAAAAGGVMLVRRAMLERLGGLEPIRGALIDDCALAAAIKRKGGRLALDLAEGTESLRRYDGWRGPWEMVARCAYDQLGHSPVLLAGTVAAMALAFLAPPLLALSGSGAGALLAWGLMTLAILPMVRFYRLNPAWAAALPLTALFYLAATVESARRHMAGSGGRWKGRVRASAL